MTQKQKLLLIIASVAAVVIFVVLGSLGGGGKVRVELSVSPPDAVVTMDGKVTKGLEVKLSKGIHTFTVTRKYFADLTKKVDTSSLKNGDTIFLLLDPNTPEGTKYLLDHAGDQALREQAGTISAEATQEELAKRYPYLGNLPYEAIDFKIDYSLDKKNNLSLQITLHPVLTPDQSNYKAELQQYKDEALSYLKSIGADTSGIPITYDPPVE